MKIEPHPDVIAYLCREIPHVERRDLIATWQNAPLHFQRQFNLNRYPVEPAEFTAARTLFVEWFHHRGDKEDKALLHAALWSLLTPFITGRRI